MTNNGDANHALCAFALWEAQVATQQLRIENEALQQEVARLKSGEAVLKEVPKPTPSPKSK